MTHIPVLLSEILAFLNPQPGQIFIDCTVGGGGHFKEIYKKIQPNGRILGIDFNAQAVGNLKAENLKGAALVQDNFKNLRKIAEKENFLEADGILMDLGFSSIELESGIGLSFLKDEPLDMRIDSRSEISAKDIVNSWQEDDLIKIFSEYGEERFSKRIAKEIVNSRKTKKIQTTFELVDTIKKAIPPKFRYGKIHFSTKVFQALRIAVNNELENLEEALKLAEESLVLGGKIAVISFHSGEDRIVKNFFRSSEKLKILTKKPIIPKEDEVKENPRSRSAKLRVAERI
ncbi:MAG: 16S rRNA (cytosine(1402)-N(4))-methyltransferase RsmH [bacterium]